MDNKREIYNKICDKLQTVEDKQTILSKFIVIMKLVKKTLNYLNNLIIFILSGNRSKLDRKINVKKKIARNCEKKERENFKREICLLNQTKIKQIFPSSHVQKLFTQVTTLPLRELLEATNNFHKCRMVFLVINSRRNLIFVVPFFFPQNLRHLV